MRRFKFVGNSQQAGQYKWTPPIIGNIYEEDDLIGEMEVSYWVSEEVKDSIRAEWEEVTDDRVLDETQKAYYVGNKNWISCKIETVIDGKSVVSEFGTNDLEEFKKFVGNLI